MISRAKLARLIFICAYSIMWIEYILIIGLSAFGISMEGMRKVNTSRMLPLGESIITNITNSPQYELLFAGRTICLFFAFTTYTGIDNFLGLLVCHVCGQLDILNNRLMNLDRYAHFRNVLKYCVLKHVQLLKFVFFYVSHIVINICV